MMLRELFGVIKNVKEYTEKVLGEIGNILEREML
jgi:hypothetical protein